MKKDWSRSWFVVILPFVAVVTLYATYDSARNSFFFCRSGLCSEAIPQNIWKVFKIDPKPDAAATNVAGVTPQDSASTELKVRESTALRYSGRMTWYFLAMVYLFVCIGALATSSVIIFKLFSRSLLWMLVALSLSFLIGLFLYRRPDLHMVMFTEIFKQTIPKDVPGIHGITNFLDSFGNAAAFSLLLTSCATLVPSYGSSFPEGLKQLSRRTRYLTTVLYSGTLLLVVTVLLKSSIYQWSLAFTSREPQASKIAANFVSSLLAVEGGFYTLVLVGVYLPAAVILQRRAYSLDKLPSKESEREEALKENGMTFSFTESLPRVLAILGPVLAGPVGEFLSRSS